MLTNKKVNKIRQKIAVGLLFIIIMIMAAAFLFLSPSPALAQSSANNMLWGGYEGNVQQTTGLGTTDIRIVIAKIIRYLLGFLGIIAVLLIMYAGWLWMSSGGNEEKVARAKKTLINAVIGLVIIIASFGIVTFILNRLLGAATGMGGPGPGPGPGSPGLGVSALGNCTLESVYPEPNQREVPRNTAMIVTFKEEINPATVMDAGGNILTDGRIKIYKSIDEPADFITDVSVSATTDNKTFVFMPDNYLGSPSEYIWYTVYLSNDIEKADGHGVFDTCAIDYFQWEFEVSNKIDLTPPQVKENGVFPPPDNAQDTKSGAPAVQAVGSITVSSQPQVHAPATAGTPVSIGSSPAATVVIDTHCQENGTLTVTIATDGVTAQLTRSTTMLGSATFSNNSVTFSGVFTLTVPSGGYVAGNSWNIDVTAEIQADTLTVGSIIYTFVAGAPSGYQIQVNGTDGTANNINIALSTHPKVEVFPPYIPGPGSDTVGIRAQVAGATGNSIELATSNTTALSINPMSGGQDSEEIITINDKRDQPRNAVIQTNFNEAINPITVSGSAADVASYLRIVNAIASPVPTGGACTYDADCVSFSCDSGFCTGSNSYLEGTFMVANQYRTVEFISDNQCGINACGEPIYCLPENSHLRVELIAANLEGCVNCAAKTPFTDCIGGHCYNSATNENHPLSAIPLDGIADVALNSLDGDRSGDAEGPVGFYDENSSSGNGDNFQWSFYISDEIDLNPPVITSTNPIHSITDVSLSDPIEINFNKLMMANSLKTGSTEIFNGQEYTEHKLINFWNFANQPTGYWIAKDDIDNSSPLDGEPDYTQAEIRHSLLADSTSYRAQVGSGVRDIYQNCYKPSSSATCTGNPSCCGEVPTVGSSCP
jgi:hypothetical protein